jgi:Bacterial SH3 domain
MVSLTGDDNARVSRNIANIDRGGPASASDMVGASWKARQYVFGHEKRERDRRDAERAATQTSTPYSGSSTGVSVASYAGGGGSDFLENFPVGIKAFCGFLALTCIGALVLSTGIWMAGDEKPSALGVCLAIAGFCAGGIGVLGLISNINALVDAVVELIHAIGRFVLSWVLVPLMVVSLGGVIIGEMANGDHNMPSPTSQISSSGAGAPSTAFIAAVNASSATPPESVPQKFAIVTSANYQPNPTLAPGEPFMVWVRTGPGTNFDKVTKIPEGTKVVVIGQTQNGWTEVQLTPSVSSESAPQSVMHGFIASILLSDI